jgi:hypothetical protein
MSAMLAHIEPEQASIPPAAAHRSPGPDLTYRGTLVFLDAYVAVTTAIAVTATVTVAVTVAAAARR